jgi:sulfite reductase (NADPH) flavoprotein alpha-component
MIGPGTGIAPFRAFLEERAATGASGKNWIFFGEQRREFDFLYREELEGYLQRGVLTRLDTAFSRDQQHKLYVQHRMKENAAELWAWLQEGAHVYVCGDARRMALDVDHALHAIVAEQGQMTPDAAKAYIKEMSKAKRYQRDVY